jgi:Cu(I)/Ag(I) efflux system membrane protein CusA/SilA
VQLDARLDDTSTQHADQPCRLDGRAVRKEHAPPEDGRAHALRDAVCVERLGLLGCADLRRGGDGVLDGLGADSYFGMPVSRQQRLLKWLAKSVRLPPGVSVQWSGQFEYLERAMKRLAVVIPFTLAIIFVLLYLTFRRFDEALVLMATLPFALIGGFWYAYLLGHPLSVASAVGFVALAGVAAEFGVVMLIYLKQALERRLADGAALTHEVLREAIDEGAVLRVRPKAMTVAVILAGLAPIMWSEGAGAEIMQRIAAPMIGGMVSAPLLSMLVIPAAYLLLRRPPRMRRTAASPEPLANPAR